ncbi:hypothetical protein [Colwellia sp. E2M01]|uniref:hypothetical protein n=1 Tax=Colwellia sp. E2M01 TaxID=2841561 RepID=UPI001C09785A|nr:hypothetical protein [Colwellia sp. E2M01]MBU2869350.1 hypothetical protein [Colwellia sp. E2M01]
MKKFNLAALPLAVAGVFASTSAFAGTEACFEVYKTTNDAAGVVEAHDILYTPAACTTTRTVAGATSLASVVNTSIAWELTGDVDVDLETTGALPRSVIVYIPTTDIPPASRITMELSGADFGTANANQIYLVSKDLATGEYQTVASSDGSFNDTSKVEFLTKAGVTIGAGTRLMLSQTNPEGVAEDGTLIESIAIHIENDETCNIDPEVTIKAISAFTDAGTIIAGGKSSNTGATAIVDISEQFEIVVSPQATNEILVDAEDPSFRQEFVVEQNGSGDWVGQVISTDGSIDTSAFWETRFVNNHDSLDQAVAVHADDEVILSTYTTAPTGDGVTLSLLANIGDGAFDNLGNGTVLDAAQADHITIAADTDVQLVDIEDLGTDLIPLTETSMSYDIDAAELFPSDADTNVFVAARLMNSDDEVMEFNYEVKTTWSMDFNNSAYLDKNGCETPTPFEVGVNGAVLKVPYALTDASSGFVRITSEHTTEATIFMDIFDESSNEEKNVNLGQIAPKASNVLRTSDLLAAAKSAGYAGTGSRHTMTFTVTAPKNKVHGVSVQTVPGGVDRVLPVLDQNDWSE